MPKFYSHCVKQIVKRIPSLTCLLISIFPALSFATGDTPVAEGLGYLTNAMYGTTGVAIATIAIMVVGLLCLGHVIRWSALGYTIMGVSIIFGAGSIVSGITSLIHK